MMPARKDIASEGTLNLETAQAYRDEVNRKKRVKLSGSFLCASHSVINSA